MWIFLTALLPGILKDKKHYSLFFSMIVIIIIAFGIQFKLWAQPVIVEIKEKQLSQYEEILNRLDEIDKKQDNLLEKLYNLKERSRNPATVGGDECDLTNQRK